LKTDSKVRICVPLCERTFDAVEADLSEATAVADLIEIRLDCLDPQELETAPARLASISKNSSVPLILTLRPAEEGGKRELGPDERRTFWQRIAVEKALLDIELNLLKAVEPGAIDWSCVICSHHDFSSVLRDLNEIYNEMVQTPARILKLAVHASDVTDCLAVFDLLKRARADRREMIAIAMGAAGVITRVLGPLYGSYLTYGSLTSLSGTAPGQVTARELRNTYRIDEIDEQTQIVGLVGLPTSHSISPHIHNSAFVTAGLNAVYLPFEVRDLAAFMKRMVHPGSRELDWQLRGLSVTAPHKLAVIDYLDWIDPEAKEIGAVNTIVVTEEGLRGYNTDAAGLLSPLLERLSSLVDLNCAVIGAGGAARTAAWALRQQGAQVKIFARQPDQARALADSLDVAWGELQAVQFGNFDLVVNATPVGTFGHLQNQTIVTRDQLRGARLLYDLVYNPRETQLMREAKAAGCDALGGLAMLVAQAMEQFRLWTGRAAPVASMRTAAEKALPSR
jgi:3-dehydroquinate dehydratase / shikimate dehydrogenase